MNKKLIYFTNIISPYRHDFFNQLSVYFELTVVYQAEFFGGVPAEWHPKNSDFNYKAVFLSDGIIEEKKIKLSAIPILFKDWDYIVFTNYGYITEFVYILISILFRKKFIIEVDGMIDKKDTYFKKIMKELIFKKASRVFSPSRASDKVIYKYNSKSIIDRYPFSSVCKKDVLKKTLSKMEKSSLKKQYGFSENDFLVISIGQFVHRKGFDILLESAKKIDTGVTLMIVGGQPDQKLLLLAREAKVKVIFQSFHNKNVIYDLLRMANVFALATREDVWGLVINEALACGLPIITTDKCNSGVELIVNGWNGFIIKNESCEELSDRINTLFRDTKLLEDISSNALLTARKYTIETMVDAHVNLLNDS
jgi:glycosyltransferase involved in cell wall biosynthesis